MQSEPSELEKAELIQQSGFLEDLSDQQLVDLQQPSYEDYTISTEEPTTTETLYIMDPNSAGSYRVTGMFQNVQINNEESQTVHQLLDRPRISFFDLSWSNWYGTAD